MSNVEMVRNETREKFLKMIHNSWTWDRLTEQERLLCEWSLCNFPLVAFREKRHMWDALQHVYETFLRAIGYKPIGWREPSGENTTF